MLNRIIRVTEEGWEYEADQRHVDLIVGALGLTEANSAKTPCEDEKEWGREENEELLEPTEATRYRGIAARCNYLSVDRPDMMFATKEVCRRMANPTVGAYKRLKRLGRYLVERPRGEFSYEWQGEEDMVDGFTDSDWAGCKGTAKSTSGGAIMIGSHFLKGWSRTQQSITLSSAEAELTAMVKASCETLGILNMTRDFGKGYKGAIHADSSAALGICKRKGSGKLRHISVGLLWIQEKEERK